MPINRAGRALEQLIARYFDAPLPEPDGLPKYVRPIPRWMEDAGLRLAYPIAFVNLLGTLFGFWYYGFHPIPFSDPLVVDWLHVLAFFGCIKLGLWTPYVQVWLNGPGHVVTWMWHFLIWSHLAMAIEAFLIHRYAEFRVGAIAVAGGWYLFNDVLDYFVPIVGDPHHTDVIAEWTGSGFDHASHVHDLAAAAAVVLTVVALFLALATRVEKVKHDG
jgi:uncharacterized membrane protein YpjA